MSFYTFELNPLLTPTIWISYKIARARGYYGSRLARELATKLGFTGLLPAKCCPPHTMRSPNERPCRILFAISSFGKPCTRLSEGNNEPIGSTGVSTNMDSESPATLLHSLKLTPLRFNMQIYKYEKQFEDAI